MTKYVNFIKSELNYEAKVKSVKIGKNEEDDFTNSLTQHPFEQVKQIDLDGIEDCQFIDTWEFFVSKTFVNS